LNQELMEVRDQVTLLLKAQQTEQVAGLLAAVHPADLAELLKEFDPSERAMILAQLPAELAAETISEMEPEDQVALLRALGRERAGHILQQMSVDDVADLVGELPPDQARSLLQWMDREDAADVQELLEFPPDSAGGLMTTEYIAVPASMSVQSVIEELRRLAPDVETPYYVYVVNEQNQLVGVLSLRDLIITNPETPVREIMRTQVVSVRLLDDQEQVARIVSRYNLLAVPVVDDAGRLRGIVTADDVMDVMEEEATEDIYRAAGVGEEEQDLDPYGHIWEAIRSRLPWLLGLLFLSMISGKVIEHFNNLMAAAGALSFFITTMAGGSGNAATQSLTVVVRGLGTGEIQPSQVLRVLWREVRVGLVVGAVCGLVIGLIGLIVHHNLLVGVIAGLALFVNLTLAKAAGALVPFLMVSLGLDPAVASGPFIATITDTTSMLIYFNIAAAVLRHAGLQ